MAKKVGKRTLTVETLACKLLERHGWRAGITERRITPYLKRDLYGIGDVLAIKANRTLLLQVTTSPNHSTRLKKIRSPECFGMALLWVESREFGVLSISVSGVWRLSVLGVVDDAPVWGELKTDTLREWLAGNN